MDLIYDIETYPNCFTLAAEFAESEIRFIFEISDYQNDSKELLTFLRWCEDNKVRMVGFNNCGFDYPVIHKFMGGSRSAKDLYQHAQMIIHSQDNDAFKSFYTIWPSDRRIEQLDLFLIHHFNNKAKMTSLKLLEFNMRSDSVQDLPFPVGTVLSREQVKLLKQYNQHDVKMTKQFYHRTLPMIRFREELTNKYQRDFMNHNDVKIGTTIFEMELEKAGVSLYTHGTLGKKPIQTIRKTIALKDAILPWIQFQRPELQQVLEWLKRQTITETKGVFKGLQARVDGFNFVFGVGGIHGSVESKVIHSDDEYMIIDLDVASYYPNLAIGQKFYPKHLGEKFCDIYKELFERRRKYPKGTAENAMLKLALNGTYGQSNSQFSVFYDPLFTMSITLNGQLLLCLLAEQLMNISGLSLIQLNTDGLTVRLPRTSKASLNLIRHQWEMLTRLELEEARYESMYIRDVNSYSAIYEGGKVKRKGAYEYQLEWHQNASALVVPKVAEQHLVYGKPIRETIEKWPDVMDFMLRTKVPRSSVLVINHGDEDEVLQNVTRYIVTQDGGYLYKLMPPTPTMLKAGKQDWRRIGINTGWRVTPANNITGQDYNIDYNFYVDEVEKLCLGLS